MAECSFGPFVLNDAAKRLLRDGVEVPMRPQAFAARRALVAHSGQFLNHDLEPVSAAAEARAETPELTPT